MFMRFGASLRSAKIGLTAEEEKGIWKEVREIESRNNFSPESRRYLELKNRIVVSCFEKIFYVAWKQHQRAPHADPWDLFQEGVLFLLLDNKTFGRFDLDCGARFSTYAQKSLSGAIVRAAQEQKLPVPMPRKAWEQLSLSERIERKFAESGQDADIAAISDMMELSAEQLLLIRAHAKGRTVPLNSPISEDDYRTEAERFFDHRPSVEEVMARLSLNPVLKKALGFLSEKEERVMRYRFGMDDEEGTERTLEEVGQKMGLTRERVRQIEHVACKKLIKILSNRCFVGGIKEARVHLT